MRYVLLVLTVLAFLVVPQFSYASCQQITIMKDGEIKFCQVCTFGSQTTITCF